MKRLKYFALAALVAFAACDEGDEVVVPEPDVGTISGTVTVDGTGLAGVTVTLSSGATTTTAANGDYTFSDVQAGAYTVSISGTPSDAAFPTTSKAAVINQAGQVVDVDFAGSFITTSAISASVSVPGVGPLSGATVAISGQSSASAVTGSNGTVTFSGLRAGDYTVTATLSSADAALYDLDTSSVDVTLDVDELEAVSFTATPKTISTISGRMFIDEATKNNVFDAGSEENLTIADVDVVIEGVSVGVFDTLQTDANGEYELSGLPAANYRISLDTSPFNGAVALGTQNDVVITLGVADTEVVDFGFDIIEQSIVIGAFLGADEDNGPSGVASRVQGISGVDIDLYTTAQNAQGAGVPGLLDDANTGSSGLATISFARANDTDPFGGPSDNVVFAVINPANFGSFTQNGEAVIEIPFPATDSIVTSDDVFDYLNSDVTFAVRIEEGDSDRYPDIGVRQEDLASDTTNNAGLAAQFTDEDGMVYFGSPSGPAEYFFQFQETQPNLPDGTPPMGTSGITIWPAPYSMTYAGGEGFAAGDYIGFDYDGTGLPGDTIFVGTGTIAWDEVTIRGRMHRETNDQGDVPTWQPASETLFGATAFAEVQTQRNDAGTWVDVGGPVNPNGADGRFVDPMLPSGEEYRLVASFADPALRVVLDETAVIVPGTDGSDQIARPCPLVDAGSTVSPATCSTFAMKFENGTVEGTVLYRDGSPAGGVDVTISVADSTIQGRASTVGDTVVTTDGTGFFTTNASVREGWYDVTPVENADIVFFESTNGATKVAEIEDQSDVESVATATPARSSLALPTSSPAASFHGFDPNTSVSGVVVNDRDQDGNTIDTDEALIGVTVNLFRDDIDGFTEDADSLIASAITGTDGSYAFEDLIEGRYTVTVEGGPADAVVLSASATNELRFVTEAGNPSYGDTNPVPLPFWDYQNSTVQNPGTVAPNLSPDGEQFTFLFTNGTARGTVDDGTDPVASVTVTITRCLIEIDDPLTMPSAGTCDTDETGTFQNFITGSDGVYEFTDLREGIYEIEVVEESAGFTAGGAPVLVFVDGTGDLEVVDYSIN